MDSFFKEYLFETHNVLVSEREEPPEEVFATLILMEKEYGIKITKGRDIVDSDMVTFVANMLGKDIPEAFYKGFPNSIKTLTSNQKLFDQLMSYVRTYGFGCFDEASHSQVEEFIERETFNEAVTPTPVTVVYEEAAERMLKKYVNELLLGTRPLNAYRYKFVVNYLNTYKYNIEACASQNLLIRLLADTRNVELASLIRLPDVIKLVDEINFVSYRNTNIRKLNLSNKDRKFITEVINRCIRDYHCDIGYCCENKAEWCGLLHHIHYKPINGKAREFVDVIRGDKNLSPYSEFEGYMSNGDVVSAARALRRSKGNGAVLRNIRYILSRCESEEEITKVISELGRANGVLMLQVLTMMNRKIVNHDPRTFIFSKHNMQLTHTESAAETASRKSYISAGTAQLASNAIKSMLAKYYGGRLGKVYIDNAMDKIALPISESTSNGGYGVLPRGSRIEIPETKKLRAFTYWEKTDDIDLSVFGITPGGYVMEFSWRNMSLNDPESGIIFSGDQTSGYNGGSEFFDIEFDTFTKNFPKLQYLVFCNNVFSFSTFADCTCRAGYMLRDNIDSGEVFEPATVKSSFTVNGKSTFAYLFAIDLKKREFVWLNVEKQSSSRVAGTTNFDDVKSLLDAENTVSMKELFTMLATEITDNEDDADVIVSDVCENSRDGQEVIRSSDFERIIQLMN